MKHPPRQSRDETKRFVVISAGKPRRVAKKRLSPVFDLLLTVSVLSAIWLVYQILYKGLS